jgi:hypothetical protein
MITRSIPRSAAGLLALTLIGTLVVASVRTNTASQEIAAAPASAGIDISALAAVADTPNLPLLSIHDPI